MTSKNTQRIYRYNVDHNLYAVNVVVAVTVVVIVGYPSVLSITDLHAVHAVLGDELDYRFRSDGVGRRVRFLLLGI